MSLQGTLDSFPLGDVLRLLASTNKTGRLRVDGARGSGAVWVDGGAVVAAEVEPDRGVAVAEVVFELLREEDGHFTFEADLTTSASGAPLDVEPLLEEAEALLEEWRGIEAVVPSMQSWVALVPELGRNQVIVTADQWRALAAIGASRTVESLAEHFELGELGVGRMVKDLVDAGLVQIDGGEDAGEAGALDEVVEKSVRTRKPRAKAKAAAAGDGAGPDGAGGAAEELAALAGLDGGADPELASQLARLGPAGVQAVAAAARADTPEEREAALAALEGDADADGLNRGLLLKFLSSVRT